MDYKIIGEKLELKATDDFVIKHICECGQLFRYECKNNYYKIIADQNCAYVYENYNNIVKIDSNNAKFFENYFDFQNNYGIIKTRLALNPFLIEAINFGHGIRILNQDLLEVIINFIISQNNNIPRIQKTVTQLCIDLGKNFGEYFGFPSLNALKQMNEKYFISIGAGYRAKYLVSTINDLINFDFETIKHGETNDIRNRLMNFLGIGRKVADCILLFGVHRRNVFPVDTWMDKVLTDNFNLEGTRKLKSNYMEEKYKDLAGYLQQYLFYYRRNCLKFKEER